MPIPEIPKQIVWAQVLLSVSDLAIWYQLTSE
jgi:hypothetical protein